MALKAILETIEGLHEELAKEYEPVEEEGKKLYRLKVEGGEDVGALKRAKDHEKKGRQDAEAREKAAIAREKAVALEAEKRQDELDEMRRGNIPKGDVEKLEGSYKERLAKKDAEHAARLAEQVGSRDKTLRKLLVETKAMEIAGRISIAPEIMLPHVLARLTTELNGEEWVARVLDADGKPSAATFDDYEKELRATKKFEKIIIGSKATGGGANGAAGSGRGTGETTFDPTKFNRATATPKQLAEFLKWKKEQEAHK